MKLKRLVVLCAALVSARAFAASEEQGALVEKVAVRNRLFLTGGRFELGVNFGFGLISQLTEHYTGNLQLSRFNALKKQDQVLLTLRLDNFRDLDFHFVTPLTFQPDDKIELSCTPNPQPDGSTCDASVYYSGYFKNPPS